MDEERKKLEACGDGLLLAVARLYLRDQPNIPYKIHMRLISHMVNNQTLAEIAEGEGIRGREGEKLSDAFEVAIALHYYRSGFQSLRRWLWSLFDKYFNIAEEVRKILEPSPEDALFKSVRGALKMVIGQQGGEITGSTLDLATKQIVAQLSSIGQSATGQIQRTSRILI
jgi:dsRNA-specific ribonuclease